MQNILITYEPVWAISTNKGARSDNPQNVFEMSTLIRRELYGLVGKKLAAAIPILYGGSVDDKNAAGFIKHGRVDGLLVGGASLKPQIFSSIVKSVSHY